MEREKKQTILKPPNANLPYQLSINLKPSINHGTVIYVLTYLECGSVQIKAASISLTLLRPLSFFKQTDRSSLDSRAAVTHVSGGCR